MKYKVELVRANIAPFGVKCVVCEKTAKEGQTVFKYTIPEVMHVVIHKNCFTKVSEELEELGSIDSSSMKEEYTKIYMTVHGDKQ